MMNTTIRRLIQALGTAAVLASVGCIGDVEGEEEETDQTEEAWQPGDGWKPEDGGWYIICPGGAWMTTYEANHPYEVWLPTYKDVKQIDHWTLPSGRRISYVKTKKSGETLYGEVKMKRLCHGD
jgi:hypothetical protein